MPAAPQYLLQVSIRDLRVQVKLNHIEVFSERTGAGRTSTLKVNAYIIEGQNHLEVRVGAVPQRESAVPVRKRAGTAEVMLLHGESTADLGPDQHLLAYRFDAAQGQLSSPSLGTVLAAQFAAPRAFGRWAWQDATLFHEPDAGQVAQAVQRIHDALARRDLEALQEIFRYKNQELARALDTPVEELEQDQAALYRSYFDAPGWEARFMDPKGVTCRAMAGGRVVAVTTSRGDPPVGGTDGERTLLIALRMAHIDGAWRPVR